MFIYFLLKKLLQEEKIKIRIEALKRKNKPKNFFLFEEGNTL